MTHLHKPPNHKGDPMRFALLFALALLLASPVAGPVSPVAGQEIRPTAETFEALSFRNLGGAIVSGRISDVAIDPRNRSVWYVGVSSGNVFKTTNRGVTWEPIFDHYGSYSIGAVTVDSLHPDVVWVGTGENASQRSAGYGDGIYKSLDGGATFHRMGLEGSEHIGDILVDPRDSNVVYAAAQGPLWASGGDRGLYKTTDGGESWERILHVSENTGIADIVFDPTDPDIIYASSYQRRRHVGILVAGGPEGAIFKSTDAGATWREVTEGLPDTDIGRIALEVSPHYPGVVYATVAAQDDESGVFRSDDYGESWAKVNNYHPNDPQYYGELFADPHRPGRVCAVDTNLHCTTDNGLTWEPFRLDGVHVDHHEVIFDPVDPNYMMLGNDGGLYESFDAGETWRHFANLPVAQPYRVGISHEMPFYWVFGGTQDNGTPGGPVATRNTAGVRNADWMRILGGDGFQARFDPAQPSVVYGMSQGARISRVNLETGETASVAPPHVDEAGDTVYWHWDIPFVFSHYDSTRVYALGSRLARSDNRGDDWTFVSPNISRQIDRDTLEVMGRIWPDNAVWKHVYTNEYGIGVAFSESRLDRNLMYVGSDDGLIHVTEDGGTTWRRVDGFPGVPELAYVSCVVASRHNPNRVYSLFNNWKRGDFTPYVLRSDDRGRSWVSIAGDLPDRHVLWDLVEDPENENLLFLGTEFALFFSYQGGDEWIELTGGTPTIPFRDIELHEGMGDLVAATFGRGWWVLDDYTPLRFITPELMGREATLFQPRPAWLYDQIGFYQASSGEYAAENPPFGAILHHHLKEAVPGDDTQVQLVIRDSEGSLVAEVSVPNAPGLHRHVWNLRSRPPEAEAGEAQRRRPRSGPLVEPGTYTVTLEARAGGEAGPQEEATLLGDPVTLQVQAYPDRMRDGR